MWLGLGSLLCWLTGIPAIIFGFLARSQINAQPARYSNGSYATIGIIFGSIGTIFLIGWGLMVVLVPATNTGASASTPASTRATAAGATPKATTEAPAQPEAPPKPAEPAFISESCYSLSTKFGTTSKLSDLQKDEAWKDYKGKNFQWDLEITEVSAGILSGYTVQAKCSPRSPSIIQDIQLDYDGDAKNMVMKLQKGSVYKIRGTLTNTSTLFGLGADGMP
jgi:hypothetical protein